MQKKAFGAFEIKEVNEEKRTFKGIASTPSLDRANDVMVSKGAKFTLPMPLLFHHDAKSVIGQVINAQVTSKGIEVEIFLPLITEEGALKARVDEAYQSLKYGLVKGLSVGFIPEWENVEYTPDGGIQFNEWEWYELSLVTIPCNRDAETDFSKAYEEYKAALSKQPQKTVPDGDTSGKKHIVVKLDRPIQGGVKL
ncbi:HK97 family phage prohead protease [Acinetobacter pollinis]|uniref:HK97 family phage prohead protease n=1 Tax=Acinetobacter pollinis TaxID=2605270 RepID=UPI0018C2F579|nr:HK97 family phage prohead protease [Acinetobacter pollinis]MBF7693461.1 HK97 family phage prohead protease [Acinetobacter pollinis]MBF7700973.1 HK97 family phage prohead protease [Acinetobacter pollinis]